MGNASVLNSTINSENVGVYCGNNGQVVLENVTINSTGRCVWVTNYNGSNHTDGTATVTIKSGTYSGGTADKAVDYTNIPLVAYSGDIIVEGGNFTSAHSKFFEVMESHGSITLKGGTFGGKALSELTKTDIENMCNSTFKVTDNLDGTYTITQK